MKVLAAAEVPGRPDRVASQLLQDTPDVRVVGFYRQPGHEAKPHRSTCTVLAQLVEGEGEFSGGDAAVYGRDELHGIRALDTRLRFTAIITPRPK